MGGGNGQKSATARARNLAKQKSSNKKSVKYDAAAKANNQAYKCAVCMQTFMVTAKRAVLETHVEGKHASKGKTFADCFPTFGKVTVTAVKSKPETKEMKKKNKKRKKSTRARSNVAVLLDVYC